ncbi:hypothetical protein LINPERPRIM_LOCUS26102 [Linum perenne]
MFMLLGHFY